MALLDDKGLKYFVGKLKGMFAPKSHTHTKSQITDFPSSLPASDVSAWAKAASKPSYTKAEVGLGNVDNTADSAKSVKYATTAGSANAVAWGNVSGKPSTYPPSSHTHSYLPLSGGTTTGRITAPEVAATRYFVTPSMVGEGDTSTYYHRVDFGKAGNNKVDFYEYGGVWNFYKNTAAGKDNATLVASIQADGVHANLKGKADTAGSATNDSKNQAITGYIRGLSVSGRTVTYTRGDGTTGSITTQDTNTTYDQDTLLRIMTAPNAGAHNAVYRGKALGGDVTDAQWAAIAEGSFNDLYIGDYWTKDGINYRIAAFDYFFNSGYPACCVTHHVVIVPDTCLYDAAMNSTDTTTGGYVGSDMYKSNLEQAKTTIKSAFSGHVLNHFVYLTNAVSNGAPSGGVWFNNEAELMTERMVYGCPIFSPMSDGQKNLSSAMNNLTVEKSQLPLFALDPAAVNTRYDYWLRDVVTATYFAIVDGRGSADYSAAYYHRGVRPYFCIK